MPTISTFVCVRGGDYSWLVKQSDPAPPLDLTCCEVEVESVEWDRETRLQDMHKAAPSPSLSPGRLTYPKCLRMRRKLLASRALT